MKLLLCGVDEAGAGRWPGAVFAAAVILDPAHPIAGLADSKKLSEKKRDSLALQIRECALAWAVASASAEEIDRINILQASLLAMRRAVEGLSLVPARSARWMACIVRRWPCRPVPSSRGDSLVAEISAASILAKTARDAEMLEMHLTLSGIMVLTVTRVILRQIIWLRSHYMALPPFIGAALAR